MFYITVILIANLLIILANCIGLRPINGAEVGEVIFASLFGTVAVIAVDGISAFLIRRLPQKWFAPQRKIFSVSRRERKLYRKLHIQAWKDKVPELGMFTGFHKNELKSSTDSAYLARFLLESNYGVVIHLANAALGFLILFLPFCNPPFIWIPIFLVNMVLSLLPVAILRYHTPPLLYLYEKSLRKQS